MTSIFKCSDIQTWTFLGKRMEYYLQKKILLSPCSFSLYWYVQKLLCAYVVIDAPSTVEYMIIFLVFSMNDASD